MPIADRTSKAYDFASDLIKQIISLATGVLTLTLAFYDKFLSTSRGPTWLMVASWVVLVGCIVAGILALMALTGGLAGVDEPDLMSRGQQVFAAVQFVLFVLGMVLMVAAVVASAPA